MSSAPEPVNRVTHPAKIRARVRELAEAFENGVPDAAALPTDDQRDLIRRGLFHGVGGLFPSHRESGKVVHSGHRSNARASDVQKGGRFHETIAWNVTLLLGYVLGRERDPFHAIQTKDLMDGEWYALCRWAGLIEAEKPRWSAFYTECIWTANRGLWCYAYSRRFYHRPPLREILREMDRAYGTDVPGLPFVQGGLLDTGLALRGDIPTLPGNWRGSEAEYREMVARWQAFSTTGGTIEGNAGGAWAQDQTAE